MKYNLKNRPYITFRHYPKGTCAPDIEEMLDWFEGFEAELRAKRNQLLNCKHLHPVARLIINAKVTVIDKILGEEASG